MRVLWSVTLLALLTQGAAAQQTSLASIEGTVVDRENGAPIARAHVELRRAQAAAPAEFLGVDPSFVRPPVSGGTEAVAPDSRVVTTSTDGRFAIDGVRPGSYRLYATRSNGYVPGEYGQRTATGTGVPLTITAGQRTAVSLQMTPTASIAGRVVDANGEPSGYAHVQALKATYRQGRRVLTVMQLVQADDRGAYRLFWLPPGEYYICAKPLDLRRSSEMMHIPPPSRFGTYEQQMRPTVTAVNTRRVLDSGAIVEEQYVPAYFPGTIDEQRATPITLSAGQNLAGVDISVADSLVRTHRIRGRVIDGTTGQPVAASLQIIPRNPPAILLIPTGNANEDGTFDLWGALSGPDYVIASGRGLNGLLAIDVGNADIDGVTVSMWPGIDIPGRIVVGDRAPVNGDPDMSGVTVTLRRNPAINGLTDPATFNVGAAVRTGPDGTITFVPTREAGPGNTARADGTFTLSGVPPGDYTVVVGVKNDAYVESIRLGLRDVLSGLRVDGPRLESELEITIGKGGGAVEGRVVDGRREPVPGATVVAIPDESRGRLDLYKEGSTNASGRFRLRGLAPGSYEVLAWEHVESGAWHDPGFIRSAEGLGRRARINQNAAVEVELTAIPAKD